MTLKTVFQVEEETGFDLTGLINPSHKVQTQVNAQVVTMFLVKGVDEKTVFETQTRMEIGVSGCFTHPVLLLDLRDSFTDSPLGDRVGPPERSANMDKKAGTQDDHRAGQEVLQRDPFCWVHLLLSVFAWLTYLDR